MYFSIDDVHIICNGQPNIIFAAFDVKITRIRQLAVELGSTDRGREFFKSTYVASSNSSNIESDEECFGFE
jgi:hypothetical protein